jgi:hypothetical protein
MAARRSYGTGFALRACRPHRPRVVLRAVARGRQAAQATHRAEARRGSREGLTRAQAEAAAAATHGRGADGPYGVPRRTSRRRRDRPALSHVRGATWPQSIHPEECGERGARASRPFLWHAGDGSDPAPTLLTSWAYSSSRASRRSRSATSSGRSVRCSTSPGRLSAAGRRRTRARA